MALPLLGPFPGDVLEHGGHQVVRQGQRPRPVERRVRAFVAVGDLPEVLHAVGATQGEQPGGPVRVGGREQLDHRTADGLRPHPEPAQRRGVGRVEPELAGVLHTVGVPGEDADRQPVHQRRVPFQAQLVPFGLPPVDHRSQHPQRPVLRHPEGGHGIDGHPLPVGVEQGALDPRHPASSGKRGEVELGLLPALVDGQEDRVVDPRELVQGTAHHGAQAPVGVHDPAGLGDEEADPEAVEQVDDHAGRTVIELHATGPRRRPDDASASSEDALQCASRPGGRPSP